LTDSAAAASARGAHTHSRSREYLIHEMIDFDNAVKTVMD
jgi:hypothetical protein